MSGTEIGFIGWALVGAMIIALGIKNMFSKKPAGFWANVETIKVSDVKRYNRATGILFIVYGVVFIAGRSKYTIHSIMQRSIIFAGDLCVILMKNYISTILNMLKICQMTDGNHWARNCK